eukprot:9485743-Pyramimonas_sp.AAC.1
MAVEPRPAGGERRPSHDLPQAIPQPPPTSSHLLAQTPPCIIHLQLLSRSPPDLRPESLALRSIVGMVPTPLQKHPAPLVSPQPCPRARAIGTCDQVAAAWRSTALGQLAMSAGPMGPRRRTKQDRQRDNPDSDTLATSATLVDDEERFDARGQTSAEMAAQTAMDDADVGEMAAQIASDASGDGDIDICTVGSSEGTEIQAAEDFDAKTAAAILESKRMADAQKAAEEAEESQMQEVLALSKETANCKGHPDSFDADPPSGQERSMSSTQRYGEATQPAADA